MKMTTFVLVHGAWGGGWAWREVAAHLRAAGHEVYTPTLTGLGERFHLANPEIGLDTHIQDIVMVLEYEQLNDVILVGYSYGGMVITGVSESASDRIGQLIYLDAYVPENGQSMFDMLGAETAAFIQQMAQVYGDGWRVPHNPPDAPRTTSHPLKTAQQPVTFTNPRASALPRTFIYCTGDKAEMGPTSLPITQAAERAKRDPHWRYREMHTGHSPWESAPRELAGLLIDLAQ
jgi:pimeloyl-ACP methyl ester carboxylesterase